MNRQGDEQFDTPEKMLALARQHLERFVDWVQVFLGKKLIVIATRILSDATGAEDMLQNTLVKCFKEGPSITGDATAWVKKVHLNHCRDEYRRRQVGPEISSDCLPDSARETDDFKPDEATEVMEFALHQSSLNESERKVIELHYRQAVPRKKVADMMDITVQRVNQIHGQAIEKLTRRLNRRAGAF